MTTTPQPIAMVKIDPHKMPLKSGQKTGPLKSSIFRFREGRMRVTKILYPVNLPDIFNNY